MSLLTHCTHKAFDQAAGPPVFGSHLAGATVQEVFALYLEKANMTPVTDSERSEATCDLHTSADYQPLGEYYDRICNALNLLLGEADIRDITPLHVLTENQLPEEVRARVAMQIDAWLWAYQTCRPTLSSNSYRPCHLLRPLVQRVFLSAVKNTQVPLEALRDYSYLHTSYAAAWEESVVSRRTLTNGRENMFYTFGGLFPAGCPEGPELRAFISWVHQLDETTGTRLALRYLLAKVLRVYRVMLGFVNSTTSVGDFERRLFGVFCLAAPAAGYEEVPAAALLRSIYIAYMQLARVVTTSCNLQLLHGGDSQEGAEMVTATLVGLQDMLMKQVTPPTPINTRLLRILAEEAVDDKGTLIGVSGPDGYLFDVGIGCIAKNRRNFVAHALTVLFTYERLGVARDVLRVMIPQVQAGQAAGTMRFRLLGDKLSEYARFPLHFAVDVPAVDFSLSVRDDTRVSPGLRAALPWLPQTVQYLHFYDGPFQLSYRLPVFFGMDEYLMILVLVPCSRKTTNYLLTNYGVSPNDYLAPYRPYMQQFINMSQPAAQRAMTDQVKVSSHLSGTNSYDTHLVLPGVDAADLPKGLAVSVPTNLIDIRRYVLEDGTYDEAKISMENIFVQYRLPVPPRVFTKVIPSLLSKTL